MLELLLDTLDHLQGVLSLPHDDNAGDGLTCPVPVRHAAADVGTECHFPDIRDTDRDAAGASGEYDLADVPGRLGVAAAAHHVLGAAEFHQPATDVIVASAHRRHDLADRNVERLKLV